MSVKVKVLKRSKNSDLSVISKSEKTTRVLTIAYVRELNQGISYRIQQRELSHANSADLAAKARFR